MDRFERDEFRKAKEEALRTESSERYHDQFVHIASSIDAFWNFIREAEDKQVLSFLEYLLTYVYNEGTPNRQKELTAAQENTCKPEYTRADVTYLWAMIEHHRGS